jgi:hypothetical protein
VFRLHMDGHCRLRFWQSGDDFQRTSGTAWIVSAADGAAKFETHLVIAAAAFGVDT